MRTTMQTVARDIFVDCAARADSVETCVDADYVWIQHRYNGELLAVEYPCEHESERYAVVGQIKTRPATGELYLWTRADEISATEDAA